MKTRYVFLLDTSIYSIESGFFHQVLTSIKSCVDSLPQDKNVEMCILTFDTSLTFYNVAVSGEISLMHVGEVDDPFIPVPLKKLMMDIVIDRERIDIVIDKIFNMYSNTTAG